MTKKDLNDHNERSHVTSPEKHLTMSPEHLDAILNGEAEFHETEEAD